MSRTFLISDTHFFHYNILKFTRQDGTPLRPFQTLSEMHEEMIERWNSVVSDNDKVYHLGDVGFSNESSLRILKSLNGSKVLIKGNHDNQKPQTYLKYFRDIRGSHTLNRFVLTHIPIHPESLYRWRANIHGHLHTNTLNDPRYYNVSVEQINYTPIDFEEICEHYKKIPSS